ncbi:MAG: endolytic transglycosylase MltG [Maritimibacter sp.]
MWRNIASTALSFFVVLLIAFGGLIAWGQKQYSAPGPLASAICLKVPSGSSFRTISKTLSAQGAVSSDSILRIGANYGGRAQDLKAGSFLVPEGASMAEIVDIVTRGGASTCGSEIVYRIGILGAEYQVRELDPGTERFVTRAEFTPEAEQIPASYLRMRDSADTRYRIAVAEGATVWQIANALSQADFLDGDAAELPPEGMLAPDSYEVRAGDKVADVLEQMRAEQQGRLDAAWANRAGDLPYDTPEEALIMASIVEKETGIATERKQVASVFVNRLRRGMRLQTDPSVIYGLTHGEGSLGRGLRQSELRGDTPYNTYVNAGLPPTPIANPGLDAIEAAMNPATTEYLYFVAKTLNPADGHVFAATLNEHNRNVAKLRALEAQQ